MPQFLTYYRAPTFICTDIGPARDPQPFSLSQHLLSMQNLHTHTHTPCSVHTYHTHLHEYRLLEDTHVSIPKLPSFF